MTVRTVTVRKRKGLRRCCGCGEEIQDGEVHYAQSISVPGKKDKWQDIYSHIECRGRGP